MKSYNELNKADQQILLDAPLLAFLLIAGADGKIDGEERRWAGRLMQTFSYKTKNGLQHYFEHAAQDFLSRADVLLNSLPTDTEKRNQAISQALQQLNGIFEGMNPLQAGTIYHQLKKLANETAKASGGFLRIGAISAAENAWVGLPMLDALPLPEGLNDAEEWEEEKDDFWEEKD